MLELRLFDDDTTSLVKKLYSRGVHNADKLVNSVRSFNVARKRLQCRLDSVLCGLNNDAKKFEESICGGINERLRYDIKSKKCLSKQLKDELTQIEQELKEMLYNIPNVPNNKVPIGKDSADNEVVFQTEIPYVNNKVPHYELIKKFDIIDFQLGNKLTGAGFPVYKGCGAKLQRALVNFFLDEAVSIGFNEYELPILCNKDSFYGTGQLPDKEQQMYSVSGGFYMIPTAEVPLTNMYRDVVVDEVTLPIRLTGYTPCFRREAGSWGKDVRGLNRLHQFDKVEIVEIVKQEESYTVLEEMRRYVEGLVQKLELPYRVLALCTGDLGFNSAFTYDIEVYSVGQGMWLEASSISNFETYQSNRLNLKYRKVDGNKILAHTLNGSALALPRVMAALIELNYDGEKIHIPGVLKKYTGFDYLCMP